MAKQSITVDLRQIEGASLCARAGDGNWVCMDTSTAGGGLAAGPSPVELMLMSLAGCTAMDVVAMLKKMRVNLQDLRIEARAERAEEHPRVFKKVQLTYRFWGDIKPAQAEKVIALSHESYCSISAMLKPTVPIEHDYEIHVPSHSDAGSA